MGSCSINNNNNDDDDDDDNNNNNNTTEETEPWLEEHALLRQYVNPCGPP
jgi:hypothetical protein